jgi:GNAT superfamily N-acetyltransferase
MPKRDRLPFDRRTKGFDRDWWCGNDAPPGREYLTFALEGVELVRAQIDPVSTDVDEYVGLDLPAVVVKIEFFEVSKRVRGQGLGRQTVAGIVERYAGRSFTVASADAGGFWTKIGWTEARHVQRPTAPTFRYVLRAEQA